MSDDYLSFIPADMNHVPPIERQKSAADFLTALLLKAEEINARVSADLEFVDCGENLEKIQCPLCLAELDREWWLEAMDHSRTGDFRDLGVTPPCCRKPTTLADLIYDWPQGFAHFTLEAMNPGIGVFEASGVARVESLLGCPIRMIRAHI